MSWLQHHCEAERLAQEAELAVHEERHAQARRLRREAVPAEERPLAAVDLRVPRTLAATAVSAAALRFKAGQPERAGRLAQAVLDRGKLLPEFARVRLREIIAEAEAAPPTGDQDRTKGRK